MFGILFKQGYMKKKDPTIVLFLAMFNNGFDHGNFIIEPKTQGCKQVTWITEDKGKVFSMVIRS